MSAICDRFREFFIKVWPVLWKLACNFWQILTHASIVIYNIIYTHKNNKNIKWGNKKICGVIWHHCIRWFLFLLINISFIPFWKIATIYYKLFNCNLEKILKKPLYGKSNHLNAFLKVCALIVLHLFYTKLLSDNRSHTEINCRYAKLSPISTSIQDKFQL